VTTYIKYLLQENIFPIVLRVERKGALQKTQFLILQWQMGLSCATGRRVSTDSPVGNLKFLMRFSSSGKKMPVRLSLS